MPKFRSLAKRAVSAALNTIGRPIKFPSPLGFNFYVYPGDPKSAVMALGIHERDDIKLLKVLPITDGLILDVGANIGFYSLVAAKLFPNAKIHAFEPNPYCLQRARENCSANRSPVELHPVAVGATASSVALTYYPGVKGHAWGRIGTEYLKDGMLTATVPQVSLDDLFADSVRPVQFIKIDVEGYELQVLQGARKILERFRPIVAFEISLSFLIEKPGVYQEELRLARELGYSLYIPSGGKLEPYTWAAERVFNLWMIPPGFSAS